MVRSGHLLAIGLLLSAGASAGDTGWTKHPANPVFGSDETGSCFDANVVPGIKAKFDMYFSWRKPHSIAVMESEDGVKWSEPRIVLGPDPTSGWEDWVNRSCVVRKDGRWHMWYTGQARNYSKIGYAVSDDGRTYRRVRKMPAMIPEHPWEGFSVMNPYVRWDAARGVWRMWYASGETFEPNVLCYAESKDGLTWEKSPINPIFVHGKKKDWDCDRVGGCEVHPLDDGRWAMFYIGYSDISRAQVGVAVSPDGVTQWRRVGTGPIVAPDPESWDCNACYKPTVWKDSASARWFLWYNGRRQYSERIGLVIHEGLDLESKKGNE